MHEGMSGINQQQGGLSSSDEISLTELLLIVWKYRYSGLLAAAVPILLAFVYLYLAPPVFRVEAHLQAPLSQDVDALNFDARDKEKRYQPDAIYRHFIDRLNSLSIRRGFFKESGLNKLYGDDKPFEQIFKEAFDRNLIVTVPKNEKDATVKIQFDFGDAVKAAELLNSYINKVQHYTVREMVDNVTHDIQMRIKFIEEDIESKRKLVKERRLDSIVRMQEALNIAKKLGIRKPVDFNSLSEKNADHSGVSVNTNQMPLYSLGSVAIAAEIEELQNRKSDDPYISNLRDLQEELAFLKAVVIHPELVKVVRIDQEAIVPEKKIKPKGLLVLAVAVMLGILFGLMMIFVMHFVAVFKQNVNEHNH